MPGPAAEALQIAPPALKEEAKDSYTFFRADRHEGPQFLHLKSQWQAAGNSLLITVLQAIGPKGEGEPVTRFERRVDGFAATLNSGARIDCIARLIDASDANPAGLESTLTVTQANGETSGIVLGNESHEFGPGASLVLPIVAPIRDLVISPERNVFRRLCGGVHRLSTKRTSSCTTASTAAIRRSLAHSTTSPIRLTGSAMVKARAFRKGLSQMPADRTSGVLMGRVFTAVFTRVDPLAADSVAEEKLKPGLKFRYCQGKWPYLLFGAPTLQPVKTGLCHNALRHDRQRRSPGRFRLLLRGIPARARGWRVYPSRPGRIHEIPSAGRL